MAWMSVIKNRDFKNNYNHVWFFSISHVRWLICMWKVYPQCAGLLKMNSSCPCMQVSCLSITDIVLEKGKCWYKHLFLQALFFRVQRAVRDTARYATSTILPICCFGLILFTMKGWKAKQTTTGVQRFRENKQKTTTTKQQPCIAFYLARFSQFMALMVIISPWENAGMAMRQKQLESN